MNYKDGIYQCCGQEPVLRLQIRYVQNTEIPYVRYECRACGEFGALSLNEEEAAAYWPYGRRKDLQMG